MSSVLSLGYFVLAFFLVFSFSLLITSIFKTSNLPTFLLSLYLISFSNIIFVSEIAGIINLLNNRLFFLTIHFILSAIAYYLWRRRGQPEIFGHFIKTFTQLKSKNIISSMKKWPQIWILAAVVIAIYLFSAFLILKVPPNNHDSMTCHMVRVGYWLQHGNFWPWPTWNSTCVVYPINAQVQILWTVLFWGSDRLAGFPQWLAALAGIIAVYGLARLIWWKKQQCIFAALMWALLPEILLQSTTTQNHLIAGSLFALALYLLFFGIKTNKYEVLFLSSLALALALGTHQLVFFALPGLLVTALIICIKLKQRGFKLILFWGSVTILLFLIFGSFMYIVNLPYYGNLFMNNNSSSTDESLVTDGKETKQEITIFLQNLAMNTLRYLYESFDLTGLPNSLSSQIYDLRTNVVAKFVNTLNLPMDGNGFTLSWRPKAVQEDSAWFGIIGFFLFYILFFTQLISGIKRRDPFRLGIIFILILYVFVWACFVVEITGSVWQGRYFIIISLIISPFIASFPLSRGFYRTVSWILILISIFQASYITINNRSKSLIGPNSIWGLGWQQKIMTNSREYIKMSDAVEKQVPLNDTLGLVLYQGSYEYPLFGKYLTRKLIPIYPDEQLSNYDWVKGQNINWILLCKPIGFPQNFTQVDSFNIFQRTCYLLSKNKT